MKRLISVSVMILFTVMAVSSCSKNAEVTETASVKVSADEYEVLSPWADVDPVPVRGISPRIDSLEGKKIGLFANFKRAAIPIVTEIEKRLKEKYPNIETSLFHSTLPNVTETETINKEKFTAWAKSVDAVIGVVGD